MFPGIVLVIGFSSLLPAQQPAPGDRDQIGEVLGQPVYRDQLASQSLGQLFFVPIEAKYREAHKAEVEPTAAEIDAVAELFDNKHNEQMKEQGTMLRERLQEIEEQLARAELTPEKKQKLQIEKTGLEGRLRPPGRFFAQFLLKNWKFQRHLYDRYGGGRILWQQAGLEAFDAMHKWLQDQEKQGKFQITDPKLRDALYYYWTTHNHGAFLTDDKERIRTEFLEPEWAPATPAKN